MRYLGEYEDNPTAQALIEHLQEEADIAPDIAVEHWIDAYNELISLLYREIIGDKVTLPVISLGNLKGGVNQPDTAAVFLEYPSVKFYKIEGDQTDYASAIVRYDDIESIYYGTRELTRTTIELGLVFERMYFDVTTLMDGAKFETAFADSDTIIAIKGKELSPLTAIVTYRPPYVTCTGTSTWSSTHVPVPREFLFLVESKLRGEIYKLANEDNLAAKWLNDYNNGLETFRMWVQERKARTGR